MNEEITTHFHVCLHMSKNDIMDIYDVIHSSYQIKTPKN